MASSPTKTALAALNKRGIVLTDRELHLAVLYGMARNACYALSNGEVSLAEATARIDEAVRKFHELEAESASDDLIP